jgi:hypothetical protein
MNIERINKKDVHLGEVSQWIHITQKVIWQFRKQLESAVEFRSFHLGKEENLSRTDTFDFDKYVLKREKEENY